MLKNDLNDFHSRESHHKASEVEEIVEKRFQRKKISQLKKY